MREIAIKELGDIKELDDFIAKTNEKANQVKGLVVADDGDIKLISKDIKELKDREDILKIAEEKLIELAGIDRVGLAISNSREQRLLANKNVQNAKQEIKNKALDYFTSNADELIKNSKACDSYKRDFDIRQMAQDTISGKSKDLMDFMKIELSNLKLRLDNNEKETTEKLAIINKYDDDLSRDKETLLRMQVDLIDQTLIKRKNNQEQKIKIEAERLASEERIKASEIADKRLEDASEKERLAKAEADRLAKIEADKKPILLINKQYSVTAIATYNFHTESKQDKEIVGDELEEWANTALWHNFHELLEVEYEIECDGLSKNQNSFAINIDDE